MYRTDAATVLAADPFCLLVENEIIDPRYDSDYFYPARYLLRSADGGYFVQNEYSGEAIERRRRSLGQVLWGGDDIEPLTLDEAVDVYGRLQDKYVNFDHAFAHEFADDVIPEDLINEIDAEVDQMKAVATGGPRIETVSSEYKQRRRKIREQLGALRIPDPNPFQDLWEWYACWKAEHLHGYQDRRAFLDEMYRPLYDAVENYRTARMDPSLPGIEKTGWRQGDLEVDNLRRELASAHEVRAYQSIGTRSRELLLTLVEACHDPATHGGAGKGANDRFEAVVNFYAAGSGNQELRNLIKRTFDYANNVQHDRSASLTHAQIVAEATVSVVRLMRLVITEASDDDQ